MGYRDLEGVARSVEEKTVLCSNMTIGCNLYLEELRSHSGSRMKLDVRALFRLCAGSLFDSAPAMRRFTQICVCVALFLGVPSLVYWLRTQVARKLSRPLRP